MRAGAQGAEVGRLQGHLLGIDPCTAPPVLAAAGEAAQGMFVASPYFNLDSGRPQARQAALAIFGKYAPKNIALDSLALAGLSEIINSPDVANGLPDSKLTSAGLLAAFKDGKAHPNFLAHDICATASRFRRSPRRVTSGSR